MARLLLFDIDGTLLDAAGSGLRALDRVMAETYGATAASTGVEFVGCTDLSIWHGVFDKCGLGTERFAQDRGLLEERYLTLLQEELAVRQVRVMAGYPALLDECAARGLTVGLLTGNLRRGGYAKLVATGLDGYFPFGGFGDDDTDRAALLPRALAAAQAHTGVMFAPAETVLIGDTLHDYRCARSGGAKVLLVATGHVPAGVLRAAQPDLYFDDCSVTGAVADALARC